MPVNAAVTRARAALERESPRAALDILQQAAGMAPDDAAVNHELGRVHLLLKDPRAAVSVLQRALASDPDSAAIRNDLGRALNNLRLLKPAEKAFREALERAPNWDEAHVNLGHALRGQGRFHEALDAFDRGLELNPDNARAAFNAGTIHAELRNPAVAAARFAVATSIAPQWGDAWFNLGLMQQSAGHNELAVPALKKAEVLLPASAEVHSSLGSALQSQGDLAEAEASFRRALACAPGLASARAALAGVLDLTGRSDEARAMLLPALGEADPDPILLVALANMRPGNALAESLLERLQVAARSQSVDTLTEALIHFSIGDLLDARADHPSAFGHYARGNALRRQRFDTGALEDYTNRIIELVRATGESLDHSGPRPLFIVGMPRSGTSLVEQILVSHSAIAGAGEQRALAMALRSVVPATELSPTRLTALTTAELAQISRHYLDVLEPIAGGAPLCTDKMWQNFEYLWLIRRLYPHAPVVHVARHPLDVGLSCYTRSFGAAAPPFAADLQHIGAYYAHYRRVMNAWHEREDERTLTVRYEALVAEPEDQVRRLIGFLGLDFEPDCLEFHRTHRAVRTASYAQVNRPIYRTSVGRWRLYEQQLAPLVEALRAAGVDPLEVPTGP